VRDFEPVTMVGQACGAGRQSRDAVSTAQEFIAYAKQKGDLAYSPRNGSTSTSRASC